MPAIRIGVNALYLIPGGVGGTEIYLRALLRTLAEMDAENEYFVFTNRETGPDLVPASPRFHYVPQAVRAVFRPGRLIWEQTVLPRAVKALRIGVLLNPGFTAPLSPPCPMVTVFHDMQHKRQPENFRWFDLPAWQFMLWASARRSHHLLADSRTTRDDLLSFYKLPESKVTVAPLGVDPVFFEIARRRRPQPFLLAASTLHPHKNLDGLLRAFARFRLARPDFRLVITGLRGFSTGPLLALRSSLRLDDAVEFTGWIPREQLYEKFAAAYAFFYPTRFEGFGLPLLEALAAGVPAACSDIEPLRSLAGDAAVLFNPDDAEAMLDAMRRVVMDAPLRDALARRGPERAKLYSWRNTARITLETLLHTAQTFHL